MPLLRLIVIYSAPAFCQLALWCWLGHDPNGCSMGDTLAAESLYTISSFSQPDDFIVGNPETVREIRISPQVAAQLTNNAVLPTCQRLVLRCRKLEFASNSFLTYECRHARPFSAKWKSHSPNTFEFKYESCGHELKAAQKQFSRYWQQLEISLRSTGSNHCFADAARRCFMKSLVLLLRK